MWHGPTTLEQAVAILSVVGFFGGMFLKILMVTHEQIQESEHWQ